MTDILTRIMEKDFAAVRADYDRAVQTEHPASTTVHSWADTEKIMDGTTFIISKCKILS